MDPKIKAMLDALRAAKSKGLHITGAKDVQGVPISSAPDSSIIEIDTPNNTGANGNDVVNGTVLTYNDEQLAFINSVTSRKSCVLIGAAGTGKTTTMKAAVSALITSGAVLQATIDHKHLPKQMHGVVLCSFTKRAVNNVRRVMSADLKDNCITIHKLLEYEPVYYEVMGDDGKPRNTMRFEPARTMAYPLPAEISTIIIDESSMVSCELFEQLVFATHPGTQFIFLGDINQLPPVMGSAILGFKMLTLPVIELVTVYRQALLSPIISLATAVKQGTQHPLTDKEVIDNKEHGKVTLHPLKKKAISPDAMINVCAQFFAQAIDHGGYDPEEDAILIPYNKSVGTVELNKHIANHIARKNNRETYEIIAGFNKHYLSVGDKVLCNREDAVITKIEKNALYFGSMKPKKHSTDLDYWGHYISQVKDMQDNSDDEFAVTEADIDMILAAAANDNEDRINTASHVITVVLQDSDQELHLKTSKEINDLLLGYAITVHKAQGSEWRRVYCIFHASHNTMLSRELLYTAVTRAREELYVICEKDTFVKGVLSQRIKGNTLAEKAEFFKGKLDRKEYSAIGEDSQ